MGIFRIANLELRMCVSVVCVCARARFLPPAKCSFQLWRPPCLLFSLILALSRPLPDRKCRFRNQDAKVLARPAQSLCQARFDAIHVVLQRTTPIWQQKWPPSNDLMLTVDSLVQQSRTALMLARRKMDPDLSASVEWIEGQESGCLVRARGTGVPLPGWMGGFWGLQSLWIACASLSSSLAQRMAEMVLRN